MQISSLGTSPSVSMEKTTSSRTENSAAETSDQADLQFSADSFSSLVSEAAQMPDVRNEVVESFKSRIASGTYPSEETMTGLAQALGPAIVQQARTTNS